MPHLGALTDNRETQTSKEAFGENIACYCRLCVIRNCYVIHKACAIKLRANETISNQLKVANACFRNGDKISPNMSVPT